MKKLVLCAVLYFLSAGMLMAESYPPLPDIKLCDATKEYYAKGTPPRLDEQSLTGCTALERDVLQSEDWKDFIMRLARKTEGPNQHVRLYQSFIQFDNGYPFYSFLSADHALIHAVQGYTRANDKLRIAFYIELISEWRNEVLGHLLADQDQASQMERYYSKQYREREIFRTAPVRDIAICVLKNDPMIDDFELVLGSKAVSDCLKNKS